MARGCLRWWRPNQRPHSFARWEIRAKLLHHESLYPPPNKHSNISSISLPKRVWTILFVLVALQLTPTNPTTAQIEIEPENRCSRYYREDYSYPPSLEPRILQYNLMGSITSPYTGETFQSLDQVDIEHIVALSEAHDSGLCAEDYEVRKQFAQDLDNLTLASPQVNREKGSRDFAEWQPEQGACWYAQTVVRVKSKYGLSIDANEAVALLTKLADCVYWSVPIIPPTPISIPPTPAPTLGPGGALALYDDNGNGRITCSEARAHGITPVNREHPAYQYMDDRDGDGVVCE